MNRTNAMRRANIRWQLLASVSAAALISSGLAEAQASDADRPPLWIEVGGQLSRLSDAQEAFQPAFMDSITRPSLLSPLDVQAPANYALDSEASISFQPADSDWILSASIRYGRSKTARHHHHQTKNAFVPMNFTFYGNQYGPKYYYPSRFVRMADGKASQSERHTILDFTAGKDVGLGLFGNQSSSTVSAGVRFVQFNSKSKSHLTAIPDLQYPTAPITSIFGFFDFKYSTIHFHHYTAAANIQRSFQGVGPTVAWSNSVPFAGSANSAELTLDWGANAALLFGKQKARGNHETGTKTYNLQGLQRHGGGGVYAHAVYFGDTGVPHPTHQSAHSVPFSRERSATVPNLGGFAGISLKWPNAKISVGYRADFFFGAIDGGVDTRKSENRGFFGPYASISIGIGG